MDNPRKRCSIRTLLRENIRILFLEKALLEADALIPIDEYWDDYPNLRNYLSDEQWEHFRQEDGHIYWIPPFCVSQGENIEVTHTGEAFWIQTRVLK